MAAVVGGFRLLHRLRAGGMAEVYAAERIERRGPHRGATRAAIKRLLPHLEGNRRCVDGLRQESRLAATLRHAHLVRAYGYVEEGGRGHLIMELVDGVDLAVLRARAFTRRLEVPVGAVASLCAQAAAALAYVHARGIVHGDVTPGNLLVTLSSDGTHALDERPDGRPMGEARPGLLKLCDFGLARRVDEEAGPPIAASAAYLAPEQVAGPRAVRAGDGRSDVFALAVCAWEMLAGRRLFAGGGAAATLQRVRADDRPDLAVLRPVVPPTLLTLVDRALDRDPARRPSARQLASAFAAWRSLLDGDRELAAWLRALERGESLRPPSAPALLELVEDTSGVAA